VIVMHGQAPLDPGLEDIGLRITVYNEEDQTTTDLLFNRSPVRIGRNHLNELVLNHSFVSQWHAIIGFAQHSLMVVRVSGTNSVLVNEHKLEPNEEVALSGSEVIRLKPFELHLQMVTLPPNFRQGVEGGPVSHAPTIEIAQGAGSLRALEQAALAEFDSLSRRILGRTVDEPGNLALFAARLEEVVEVFLRCFVALQKGQQQFQEATDIKVLGRRNPIERASNTAELTNALFSLVDLQSSRHLENAFKNIMIHQVALLTGLMAGVRSLLDKLSPEAIAREAAKDHRKVGVRALWQTYERIHADLAEEDAETFETIFGPQFAKAYSALVGEKGKP
jgi:predicted component of type VI protein secretion system